MTNIEKAANMEFMTHIGKGGRITLPAKIRKELQVSPGDAVILRVLEHGIQLIPLHQAVHLAQEKVKPYVPSGESLVDDLISARREESRNE